ncbi:MAG: GNAT family N-acetyltransferase [Lachnospiraceae bacterium]|nr:GNAT family N-acetyltransferase [Lachnospiraceae bacterium]
MNNTILNKIIVDISDKTVEKAFKENSAENISGRIFPYSEDSYPFSDSLYVCDTPEGCDALIKKGYPVAALVHEGNRDADFSSVKYILEQPEDISLEDYDHIYRRICGLPVDIMETDRLIIRETMLEDLDRFYEIYEDPEVISFMEPLFPRDEEEAYQQNYIRNVYSLLGIGLWTVIRKEDDMIIGRMGIEYTTEEGNVELGFVVDAGARRQGYAYEACTAIIDYARTMNGVDRVTARVRHDNNVSQNLCRKLNMTPGRELNDGLVEWTLDL